MHITYKLKWWCIGKFRIKNGGWRKLVSALYLNVSKLKGLFYDTYELNDAIINMLKCCYISKIGNNKNIKDVRVEVDDGNILSLKIRRYDNSSLPSESLILYDINIRVRYKIRG